MRENCVVSVLNAISLLLPPPTPPPLMWEEVEGGSVANLYAHPANTSMSLSRVGSRILKGGGAKISYQWYLAIGLSNSLLHTPPPLIMDMNIINLEGGGASAPIAPPLYPTLLRA